MRDLSALRAIVRCHQSAESLSDEELFWIASLARVPDRSLDTIVWAEKEAIAVLHELAQRFQNAANLPEHPLNPHQPSILTAGVKP